jgi:hypothetical protein
MKSPILWFGLNLLAIIVVTTLGPAEKSLGTNVRVVYLHGAWVWAALICIFAAAAVGLVGLITRRKAAHYWSLAIGRTGLVFWITYMPLSLWAMQTNWNGLFLSEPRWRVAMIFAIGGLILQIGITLLGFCPEFGLRGDLDVCAANHRPGHAPRLTDIRIRGLAHPDIFPAFIGINFAGCMAAGANVVWD